MTIADPVARAIATHLDTIAAGYRRAVSTDNPELLRIPLEINGQSVGFTEFRLHYIACAELLETLAREILSRRWP